MKSGIRVQPDGRECQNCGKSFTSPHSRPHRLMKYCSPRCWYSWRTANKPTRKCAVCGIVFCPSWKNIQTCGVRCGGVFRRTRKPAMCKQCGTEFERFASTPNRKFCSRPCARKYETRKLSVRCLQCKITFVRGAAFVRRRSNIFCSKECYRIYNRGQRSPLWRPGGPTEDRGSDWSFQSRAARKRDGLCCQVCLHPQKMSLLHVDHIVPFRLVNRNDPVNLITLCGECHGRKTIGERRLLKGDALGFERFLMQHSWPMERVRDAMTWWGSL